MASNKAFVQGLYDNFGKGKIDEVLKGFDANIQWHEPKGATIPGTFKGPQNVAQKVFGQLDEDWSSFEVIPKEIVEAGNRVFVLGKTRGTHATTNKSYESDFVHVMTIQSGKVTEFRSCHDTLLEQEAAQGKKLRP